MKHTPQQKLGWGKQNITESHCNKISLVNGSYNLNAKKNLAALQPSEHKESHSHTSFDLTQRFSHLNNIAEKPEKKQGMDCLSNELHHGINHLSPLLKLLITDYSSSGTDRSQNGITCEIIQNGYDKTFIQTNLDGTISIFYSNREGELIDLHEYIQKYSICFFGNNYMGLKTWSEPNKQQIIATIKYILGEDKYIDELYQLLLKYNKYPAKKTTITLLKVLHQHDLESLNLVMEKLNSSGEELKSLISDESCPEDLSRYLYSKLCRKIKNVDVDGDDEFIPFDDDKKEENNADLSKQDSKMGYRGDTGANYSELDYKAIAEKSGSKVEPALTAREKEDSETTLPASDEEWNAIMKKSGDMSLLLSIVSKIMTGVMLNFSESKIYAGANLKPGMLASITEQMQDSMDSFSKAIRGDYIEEEMYGGYQEELGYRDSLTGPSYSLEEIASA